MNLKSECFVFLGQGKVVLDGVEQSVSAGDVINVKAGVKHLIEAMTNMKLIEIRLGKVLDVNDKKKY